MFSRYVFMRTAPTSISLGWTLSPMALTVGSVCSCACSATARSINLIRSCGFCAAVFIICIELHCNHEPVQEQKFYLFLFELYTFFLMNKVPAPLAAATSA